MTTDKIPQFTLRKGQQLYRVLAEESDDKGQRLYDALDPNPFSYAVFEDGNDVRARKKDGTLIPGRFAPFRAKAGEPAAVPVLYYSTTDVGAYYEAILRPLGSSRRFIDVSNIEDKRLARVVLKDDLVLADCRQAYLKDGNNPVWPYTFDELFNQSNLKVLVATRTLAKYIFDTFPHIDGMVWDSVQANGPVPCLMLFGDRRKGQIEEEIKVLDDLATWRPYLMKGSSDGDLIVGTDLINRLEL